MLVWGYVHIHYRDTLFLERQCRFFVVNSPQGAYAILTWKYQNQHFKVESLFCTFPIVVFKAVFISWIVTIWITETANNEGPDYQGLQRTPINVINKSWLSLSRKSQFIKRCLNIFEFNLFSKKTLCKSNLSV